MMDIDMPHYLSSVSSNQSCASLGLDKCLGKILERIVTIHEIEESTKTLIHCENEVKECFHKPSCLRIHEVVKHDGARKGTFGTFAGIPWQWIKQKLSN